VGTGGIRFAATRARREVTQLSEATGMPLMVKLSPAATDTRGIAKAIAAGATISAVNAARHGHRSGAADAPGRCLRRPVRPRAQTGALRVVYEVAQVVKLPIVGIGGVGSLDDVLDFLMCGACAVQVGTAVFADPVLPLRLADELAEWCAAHGLESHHELIGAALPQRRDKPSVKQSEYRP
jgi:dihydroorotate dehydrogenase (NAD+) catalytic subunit